MSQNAFEQFGWASRLDLEDSEIQTRFHELSLETHPDHGGSLEAFERISEARQKLQHPRLRLREWMKAQDISHDERGSISNELMALFTQAHDLFSQIDRHLKKKEQASSSLAKALLEKENLSHQQSLQDFRAQLEESQQACFAQFPQLIETPQEAPRLLRDLTFLDKWIAECQRRFSSLW